jgi:hypothetical protein
MEKCYQKDIYIGVVDMEPAFRGPQRHGSWIARGFLRNLGWQQARWNDSVDYRIDQYVRWIKTNALPPDAKNGTPSPLMQTLFLMKKGLQALSRVLISLSSTPRLHYFCGR